VSGKLHIYWTCCGVRWHAKADLFVTEIRESWLQAAGNPPRPTPENG